MADHSPVPTDQLQSQIVQRTETVQIPTPDVEQVEHIDVLPPSFTLPTVHPQDAGVVPDPTPIPDSPSDTQ